MAKRSTLTAKNLAALGADELAKALLAEAKSNKVLKRKLALMLAASDGPNALANKVRGRITTLQRTRSFVDWQGVKEFERELDQLRSIIVEQVAPKAPDMAVELLWRFLDLSDATLERCDDSSGRIGDVFRAAVHDLGAIAEQAPNDQAVLADAIVERLRNNGFGVFDELMEAIAPALNSEGITRLEGNLGAWRDEVRQAIDNSIDRSTRRDFRLYAVQTALQQLADMRGDVDAFIAVEDQRALTNPVFASRIAVRLVAACRAEEALDYLDRATPETGFGRREWSDARIATFAALDRHDEAQSLRWNMFQSTLDPQYIRSYLGELPDFDDVEAEIKALDWLETHEKVDRALAFLIEWPAPDRAARLVETRYSDLDGNAYYVLSPAADALSGKFPLAATLLRRALVETTLNGAKSTRYKHAARHILEMKNQDTAIDDYGTHETHEAFMQRMRDKHFRKHGFWSQVD